MTSRHPKFQRSRQPAPRLIPALRTTWALIKESAVLFIDHGAFSRGAAIAFYAMTSLGPMLLIVVAVAGLIYGEEAARGALIGRLSAYMGTESAGFLQSAIGSAWRHGTGTFTTAIGIISLIITATGLFSEMQAALNAMWNVTPPAMTAWGLLRDRLLGLVLVLGLAVVLIVTVIISALVNAMQSQFHGSTPFGGAFSHGVSWLVSLTILTGMVGAVYKVLPDLYLRWRDVAVGALVTAALLTGGKMLIGLYIGRTGIASSYGAAGSVIAAMLWIYYSAEMFLLGAEFTSVYAQYRASLKRSPDGSAPPSDPGSAERHPPSRQVHSQ